jgi:hypothetical protein
VSSASIGYIGVREVAAANADPIQSKDRERLNVLKINHSKPRNSSEFSSAWNLVRGKGAWAVLALSRPSGRGLFLSIYRLKWKPGIGNPTYHGSLVWHFEVANSPV